MKVAIDLNDVLRDFSLHFAEIYREKVDRRVNPYDMEFTTNDYQSLFYFPNDEDYHKFIYEDNAFELYGSCPTVKHIVEYFNTFCLETIPNIDADEPIDLMIVSPMEFGISIQSTLFFLSKIGCQVREVYLPTDSKTIWDKCDILITANPNLIASKPEGKLSIRIDTDYNKETEPDYSYGSSIKFFKDKETIENIILKYGRE